MLAPPSSDEDNASTQSNKDDPEDKARGLRHGRGFLLIVPPRISAKIACRLPGMLMRLVTY